MQAEIGAAALNVKLTRPVAHRRPAIYHFWVASLRENYILIILNSSDLAGSIPIDTCSILAQYLSLSHLVLTPIEATSRIS